MKYRPTLAAPDEAALMAIQTLAFGVADMAVALDRAGGDALAVIRAIEEDGVNRMQRFIASRGGAKPGSIEIETMVQFGNALAMARERVVQARAARDH